MQVIKRIDNFENLFLRIRTLGYPNDGESIMISLINKDEVLYNIFIDNYEINSYQYWLSCLPDDTRIDVFIWSHPDEDHSLGIDKLLDKFDPKHEASIFIPTSLTRDLLKRNKKDCALPSYEYLKKHYNKEKKFQWNEISLIEGEDTRFCWRRKLVLRESDTEISFRIGFMLPNSSIVNRRVDKNKMNAGEMNDLSLFCIVELNRVRYIFSGDLAKMNIQFLDEDQLTDFRFVKIPHHGSKDPIKLVDIIQPLKVAPVHSVSTIFGSTHPYDVVMDKYGEKCEAVYSTGRGHDAFGLVDIEYNVYDYSDYKVILQGNAFEYCHKRVALPIRNFAEARIE